MSKNFEFFVSCGRYGKVGGSIRWRVPVGYKCSRWDCSLFYRKAKRRCYSGASQVVPCCVPVLPVQPGRCPGCQLLAGQLGPGLSHHITTGNLTTNYLCFNVATYVKHLPTNVLPPKYLTWPTPSTSTPLTATCLTPGCCSSLDSRYLEQEHLYFKPDKPWQYWRLHVRKNCQCRRVAIIYLYTFIL